MKTVTILLMAVVILAGWPVLVIGGEIETLLVIEPNKENPRNSEGDIIELKDGRLCLIYTRFTGGSGDHAAADLAMRTSGDDGRNWSDDRIVVQHPGSAPSVQAAGRVLAQVRARGHAAPCFASSRPRTTAWSR